MSPPHCGGQLPEPVPHAGLLSVLIISVSHPCPCLPFPPQLSAPKSMFVGMVHRRGGTDAVLHTPFLWAPDLLEPGAQEACGRVPVPVLLVCCPSHWSSPLLCVFLSVWASLFPWGMCQSTYRYSQAGKLPPWTLFWEMLFSLLTVDFVGERGVRLCPGARVIRMGPFPLQSRHSSPLHPSFSLLSVSFFPSLGGLSPLLVDSVCSKAS